jgi:hypothetical protein
VLDTTPDGTERCRGVVEVRERRDVGHARQFAKEVPRVVNNVRDHVLGEPSFYW